MTTENQECKSHGRDFVEECPRCRFLIRDELTPPQIKRLPKDSRGFPIPWNVVRGADGEPVFAANDTIKHIQAISLSLCPICGEKLDELWFVGGPKSAFHPNGWYFDLPGHKDCVRFALQVCPYLAVKNFQHDPHFEERVVKKLPKGMTGIDETTEPGRPNVFVMVNSAQMEVLPPRDKRRITPVVRPKKPFLAVEYWRHGKQLTKEAGEELVRQALAE